MISLDSCIKGVNENDWHYFKLAAVKNRLSMGKFFSALLKKYKVSEESKKDHWNEMLKGRKFLHKAEAENMRKLVVEFREKFEFR